MKLYLHSGSGYRLDEIELPPEWHREDDFESNLKHLLTLAHERELGWFLTPDEYEEMKMQFGLDDKDLEESWMYVDNTDLEHHPADEPYYVWRIDMKVEEE